MSVVDSDEGCVYSMHSCSSGKETICMFKHSCGISGTQRKGSEARDVYRRTLGLFRGRDGGNRYGCGKGIKSLRDRSAWVNGRNGGRRVLNESERFDRRPVEKCASYEEGRIRNYGRFRNGGDGMGGSNVGSLKKGSRVCNGVLRSQARRETGHGFIGQRSRKHGVKNDGDCNKGHDSSGQGKRDGSFQPAGGGAAAMNKDAAG